MRRVLCIWLPDWPIQRLTAARPERKRQPVVLEETYRGSRRVAACSAPAKALGVTVGTSMAEAEALVGAARRPETRAGRGGRNFSAGRTSLHSEPYDPPADREGLEKLAVCCGRFSPLVGLEDAPFPESLLLEITGLEHLFGSETSLATRVFNQFTGRGFTVRVAVADTLGAAWAVAHFRRMNQKEPEIATLIVPSGQTSAALCPLPVEALRLPNDVVGLLHQLGVYQVGQLEGLPRADLASRFGPCLARRLDQATGQLAEPVPVHRPPAELHARWSLEHPTARRGTIELILEQLVGRVAGMLSGRGRGVVQLECRLDCELGGCVDFSVGLFEASASPRHLFGLARMRLESLSLSGNVSAVQVRVTATAPLRQSQQELFSDARLKEYAAEVAGLIDRLSNRLGRRAVRRPRLLYDAQPELAYRYDPLSDGSTGRVARRGGRLRGRGPEELPPRPLRLIRRPIRLAAVSIMPVSIMPEGPPLRFELGTREHRIVHTWGPERIETGWWRGRPVGRDYYRIETQSGARYWLFRRLRDGRWFLHGTFE